MTARLTPVLTARWDEPDSFTPEAYRRVGGYQALAGRWQCRPVMSSPW